MTLKTTLLVKHCHFITYFTNKRFCQSEDRKCYSTLDFIWCLNIDASYVRQLHCERKLFKRHEYCSNIRVL